MSIKRFVMITIMAGLYISPLLTYAHPKVFTPREVWQQWEKNNPSSKRTIDHQAWNQFLKRYVINERGINRIKYSEVSTKDKNYLYDYIWLLSKKQIYDYNRKEQLAYWINLYNASVVKMILEHYPVDSINDISITPGIFTNSPWDTHRIRVNHVSLSLNDIKNHIILPNWNDHRILYALNDGTIGSPDITIEAFTASNLDELLDKSTINFINSERALQIIDHKLIASQLYQLHANNFGGSEQHILNHIREYAKPKLKNKLRKMKKICKYTTNLHVNDSIKSRRN